MKIALIVKEIEGGGIQKSFLTLFNSFNKYGIETYLFVLRKPKKLIINNKKIIILGHKINLINGIKLYFYIKKLKIDFAIINSEYMGKYIPLNSNKKFYTIHVIWSERIKQNISGFFKKISLKIKYNNKNLIVVSNGIKNDINENLKIKYKNIYVIADPYDFEEIEQKSKEKVPIHNYIVSVGSLLSVKRHDILIKAFSKLKNKNIKLVIVGQGNQLEKLQKLTKDLNLEKRVIFTDFEENPYKWIKNSKLLVVSSESEGFSRVIIEALYLNIPVVSTNCSPIFKEEFFPKELKPFIAKINDIENLKETIEKALEYYPNYDRRFVQQFSDKNIIKEYLKIFK